MSDDGLTDKDSAMPEQRIRAMLDKVGIPVCLLGYEYLLTSIEIMCGIPHIQTVKLVRFLYAKVAVRYETKLANVERSMRFAINAAWDKNADNIKEYLRVYRKPTIGEFIIKMVYRELCNR